MEKEECEEFLRSNKEVVERVNAAGINISAIKEHLKEVTLFESDTGENIVNGYINLFNAIKPLLTRYKKTITVGEIKKENCRLFIYLDEHGFVSLAKQYFNTGDIKSIDEGTAYNNGYLYDPKTVLLRLISIVSEVVQETKQKKKRLIRELQLSIHFINALSDTLSTYSEW